MAKIILRAGKVAIKIIILFAIFGLTFYSIKLLAPAKAQIEPEPDQFMELCREAEAYWRLDQHEQTHQFYEQAFSTWPNYVWSDDLQKIKHTLLFAESCATTGREQMALEIYQDMLDEQPEGKQAVWLIEAYESLRITLGQDPNVQEILDKFIPQLLDEEESVNALCDIGASYKAAGDTDKAFAVYEAVLDNFDTIEAVCKIASEYWQSEEPEQTQQLYEYAFNTWPEHVWDDEAEEIDHKLVFAESCAKTGLPQKALEIYQDMFDEQPEGKQAIWLIEAYESFRIELGQDPNVQPILDRFETELLDYEESPRALYDIGKAHEAAGNKDKASAAYQGILDNWSAGSGFLSTRSVIILADIALGNEPNITTELDELIAKFSDEPDLPGVILEVGQAYYNKARRRATEGDVEGERAFYRDAISIYERLLEDFADSKEAATALFRSGVLYAQELGEYQKGIDYFGAAVDNRPGYEYGWAAHSLIARFTEKLRDSGAIAEPEANARIKEAYQAVVENWPDCLWVETALLKLGQMCFAEGELVDAIMYFEMLLEKSPEKVCIVGVALIGAYEEMQDFAMAEHIRAELTERNCPGQ